MMKRMNTITVKFYSPHQQQAQTMAETHDGKNYEYRDHTADVQIHSWGNTLKEAFEACAVGLFGYMIEVDKVDIDESLEATEFEVSAEDLESLLYEFLEEFIFIFTTELLVFKDIKLTVLDTTEFKIKAVCRGEKFSKAKHGQGTEIKAITYSAMQIIEKPEKSEIYVIVDI